MTTTSQMMKHLLRSSLAVILLLNCTFSMAQESQNFTFSLAEAQEYALQNNLTRKNAALDVEIAKKKVWETTAQGLPQITGAADFQMILNDLPSLEFPGENGEVMKIEVGEKANATYSVTASQLIFSGPYIVGLQASRAYKRMSENALSKADRDIKADVANAYYTVLLLQETNTILDSSVANLRQTYKDAEALYKTGFTEESDANQVKVSLSLVESSFKETKKQLKSAENFLKYQLGIENGAHIALTQKLDEMIKGFEPTLGHGDILDANSNIDLKIMDNQIELNKLQVKLEKSSYLPNLSAYVTYQRLHKEPQVNFTPTSILGVQLSLPIFSSGMRNSKVQQAKMELDKSINSYNQVRQSLEMDLVDASAQLTVSWEKYTSQKENKELADKVYQNYRIKYAKGMASQQDLIQANDKYLQAVGNYMSAIVDLFSARIRLDKLTGKL
ncbi:MAG: TolC family protein [Bacteroidales bacterium]